jgi:hypothetical protein
VLAAGAESRGYSEMARSARYERDSREPILSWMASLGGRKASPRARTERPAWLEHMFGLPAQLAFAAEVVLAAAFVFGVALVSLAELVFGAELVLVVQLAFLARQVTAWMRRGWATVCSTAMTCRTVRRPD